MSDRIRLFVGCAPNGEDAESQMVLEYTARRNSSLPIDIVWMRLSDDPKSFWSGWNTSEWSTPFSGFRWAIPEYCNHSGEAIYMDSDMIILSDLAELWRNKWNIGDQPKAVVQAKGGWRFCVAKWDCRRAFDHILPVERLKKIPGSHSRTFSYFANNPELVQVFDRQWNNFDGENDSLSDVKILHYTDMSTQPHLKYALPRLEASGTRHWYDGEVRAHRRADVVELFDQMYEAAVRDGFSPSAYVPSKMVKYSKKSQVDYRANNGYDVTRRQ